MNPRLSERCFMQMCYFDDLRNRAYSRLAKTL
jgi:hypothetical protein